MLLSQRRREMIERNPKVIPPRLTYAQQRQSRLHPWLGIKASTNWSRSPSIPAAASRRIAPRPSVKTPATSKITLTLNTFGAYFNIALIETFRECRPI